MSTKPKKVVLAYSGGLDTSVIIPWLVETYGCEVIAYAADLGQGDELEGVREKAIRSGAQKVYIEDLRDEFVRDYIFPTLRADAVYEGKYLLATSIARPVIAKRQIEIAHREKADAVAHGATGRGNDQVRFELTYRSLDPDIRVIAPWRDPKWTIRSREDAIAYAEKRNIPLPVTRSKPYSMDRNLWHLSFEGGILEDPAKEPPKEMFVLTVSPEDAPGEPTYIEIEFEEGTPVRIDGKTMDPVKLVEYCNQIGGENGVGRVDIVEDRLVGMKSHGVYECPGATILYTSHRELLHLVLDRRTFMERQRLSILYAELAYNGEWFTPLRESIDAFVNVTEKKVTGKVRLKLFRGNCTVVGRESLNSLYSKAFATFGASELFGHEHATGFIKIFGLPIEVRARTEKQSR